MATESEVRLVIPLMMIIALLAVAPAPAAADQIRPGEWVKYTGNPVLDVGSTWDAYSVSDPAVLLENGTYKIWFNGWGGGPTNAIGFATSTNGLSWTPSGANPVLSGTASGWDQGGVRAASVILEGGTYKMWYTGKGPAGDTHRLHDLDGRNRVDQVREQSRVRRRRHGKLGSQCGRGTLRHQGRGHLQDVVPGPRRRLSRRHRLRHLSRWDRLGEVRRQSGHRRRCGRRLGLHRLRAQRALRWQSLPYVVFRQQLQQHCL